MLKTLFKGTGNYRIKKDCYIKSYYYFNHCICVVYEDVKTFSLDSCGYSGYRSTTRALNDLQRYYEAKGFRLLWRK